jgi:hypothetical protein
MIWFSILAAPVLASNARAMTEWAPLRCTFQVTYGRVFVNTRSIMHSIEPNKKPFSITVESLNLENGQAKVKLNSNDPSEVVQEMTFEAAPDGTLHSSFSEAKTGVPWWINIWDVAEEEPKALVSGLSIIRAKPGTVSPTIDTDISLRLAAAMGSVDAYALRTGIGTCERARSVGGKE